MALDIGPGMALQKGDYAGPSLDHGDEGTGVVFFARVHRESTTEAVKILGRFIVADSKGVSRPTHVSRHTDLGHRCPGSSRPRARPVHWLASV